MSRYHHGDLKEACLVAGLIVTTKSGLASVTVTSLAKALDVTPASILGHFGSIDNLKLALARRCRDVFGDAGLANRMSYPPQPWTKEQAVELFNNYFDFWMNFARTTPYIYSAAWAKYEVTEEPDDVGRGPATIKGAIQEMAAVGIVDPAKLEGASVYWLSLMHGYAMATVMTMDYPSSTFYKDRKVNDENIKQKLREGILLKKYH